MTTRGFAATGARSLEARPLVLVVEDEPTARRQIEGHLRAFGYEVIAVSDGDAALSSVRERRPDLLYLDLNLPRISGYEVLEQIRNDPELADLTVIMVTERPSLEQRAHAYEAGADAYLSKLHGLDKLAAEIGKLLKERAKRAS